MEMKITTSNGLTVQPLIPFEIAFNKKKKKKRRRKERKQLQKTCKHRISPIGIKMFRLLDSNANWVRNVGGQGGW